MSGEQFGRDYLLHEVIGRGGLGVVHRASSRLGGPPLAAKVLRAELSADPGVRDLFLREEVTLRDLRHESIVAVRDLVAEGGRMALFMELVDGPDLRAHLAGRGGVLPPAEVAAVGAQVAAALAHAHAHGVVHLDVKPENVLVVRGSDPVVVKLGDFGVAGLLFEADAVAGGTPGYAAPEVARGGPATTAADVWSLGVLLAELATGSRTAGPAVLPDPLAEIAGRCLDPDPRRRPSARSLAARLRQANAADAAPELQRTRLRRPGLAPPPAPAPQRPGRRRRAVLIVGGAIAMVAAAGGLALAAEPGRPASAPKASPPVAPTTKPATTGGTVVTAPMATVTLAAPARPARITYAAHLADDAGTLYIAVRDAAAIAYFCDGKRIEAWFKGSAAAGELELTGAKGKITGTYDARAARGTLTAGATRAFTLPPVSGRAGLYKSLAKVNGAQIKGSWIVLADGRQVGVLTAGGVPRPAPSLDTDLGVATVDGVAVDAAEVNVETGAGFQ